MSETKRIEKLEKGLEQALNALSSLEARLVGEASQRAAADLALDQRICVAEAKRST